MQTFIFTSGSLSDFLSTLEYDAKKEVTIIVKPGVHISGPIELWSNCTLEIEKGAILAFEDNPELYPPVWTRWEGVECFCMHPLIFVKDAKNVLIKGKGIIDGRGGAWWKRFEEIESDDRQIPKYNYELQLAKMNPDYKMRPGGGARPQTQFLRPPLIQFLNCENVILENLTIKNSPFWTVHTVYTKNIKLFNLTIQNPKDAINTDAIDIDSSKDVIIKGCLLDVGDDGVTLKSGSGLDGKRINIPTENVVVEDCRILASHGGIAIGSETAGGIRDVQVKNCSFQGTMRGIRIKSRRGRGGTIENIYLEDLKMDACWCPVVLSCYFTPGIREEEVEYTLSNEKQLISEVTPKIKNIGIKNVFATNIRSTAGFIAGLPESPIENVEIENYTWNLAPKEDLIDTWQTENTMERFFTNDRSIISFNVSGLKIR